MFASILSPLRTRAGARSMPRGAIRCVTSCLALVSLTACGNGAKRGTEGSVAPVTPPGTFQATPEQWRALSFASVASAAFPVQEDTDGQIATDDDVTVQVFPPFSGQVGQVFVKAGDRVIKGEALASANAADLAQAQSDLATGVANLTAAKAQLQTAQANAIRQRALLKIQGAAVRDVQQSASDLATAQAAVKGDEAALAAVRNRLRLLGVDAAHAAEATAMVRAPISGVVIQRQIGPGQYLNSTANGATTALFTISDLSKIWLTANVRETDAGRMKIGDPVQVRVTAFPGRIFDARISYVAPMLDPATRRLPVRATVVNPGEMLKPGMFATFTITSGAGEMAPAVPEAAVIYEGDDARVWIAGANRALALRQIRAGRTRDGRVEVLSGLQTGDKVVVAGALFIDRAARSD